MPRSPCAFHHYLPRADKKRSLESLIEGQELEKKGGCALSSTYYYVLCIESNHSTLESGAVVLSTIHILRLFGRSGCQQGLVSFARMRVMMGLMCLHTIP